MLRRALVAVAIVSLIAFGLWGCSASHPAAGDCVVYITKSGQRYHQDGCQYLRDSKIETTRSEAIERGYTACHVCGGSDCEH